MEYILIFLVVILIIFLLLGIKSSFLKEKNKKSVKKEEIKSSPQNFANCPVCSSSLVPGVNLRSKVFKRENATDQLCYVYGCSLCYPKVIGNLSRKCPVCHKDVESDGYLISRIFYKTKSGKPHVIINGCKNCNKKN